jgi:hypothetical protein
MYRLHLEHQHMFVLRHDRGIEEYESQYEHLNLEKVLVGCSDIIAALEIRKSGERRLNNLAKCRHAICANNHYRKELHSTNHVARFRKDSEGGRYQGCAEYSQRVWYGVGGAS